MAKQSSVFMLRKSSKKVFNFYGEYRILGSVFNYTNYFKNNLFFDYWLKYILRKILLEPLDIFYVKGSSSLKVFILMNKKYLLKKSELQGILKRKKKIGFTTSKLMKCLSWLQYKNKKTYKYDKLRSRIFIPKKFYWMSAFFIKSFFRSSDYTYYYYYYYNLYIKKVTYFYKYFVTCLQLVSKKQDKKSNFLINYVNTIYANFSFKIILFKLRKFLIVSWGNLISLKSNIFLQSMKNLIGNHTKINRLRRLNNYRWFHLKSKILFNAKNFSNYNINIFFLNFNNYTTLERIQKDYTVTDPKSNLNNNLQKSNIFNRINFTKFNLLKFHLLQNLYLKIFNNTKYLVETVLKSFYKQFKDLYFYKFYNTKNLSISVYYIKKELTSFLLKIFRKLFIKKCFLENKLGTLIFYYSSIFLFFLRYKNILWKKNLKKFYNDVKKNSLYFTLKEKFFKKIVVSLFFSLILENPDIFSKTLSEGLSKTRKHHYFLNTVEQISNTVFKVIRKYKLTTLKSITLKIRGKFNGKLKRSRRSLSIGEKIKLQNLSYNIKYSYIESYTFAGTFGIKVWFSF